MGMAETLWEPKMKPDDLFECISQAMMNAFDRDASSGWGAVVHIIEKDKVLSLIIDCFLLAFNSLNPAGYHQNIEDKNGLNYFFHADD